MPAAQLLAQVIDLSVAAERQVDVQQVGNRIARARVGAAELGETIRAINQLILDIMAEESADFEAVIADHFREVILPDEEIFVILPRRFVPERRIPIRSPE